MHLIAIKMLVGDKAKYLGLIFGITFSTLLMSQQVSIFIGVLGRTASQITDVSEADIWVMSPEMRHIDEVKPLQSFSLYRVRGVEGVEWAVPLYKGLGVIRPGNKQVQQIILMGVDNFSLIGQPPKMILGAWHDLKHPDALIIDKAGWEYIWPGEKFTLGRVVELNDKRAKIVGICEATPPFMTFPIVYTKYSNAMNYLPQGRETMSFIIAKAKEGYNSSTVARNISQQTKLQALTSNSFKWRSIKHYLTKTGIPINFGITVTLGFIVGATIAAQTFYIFIIENIKQFGALKAIGVDNQQIIFMVVLQALIVGFIGFSIGIGLAALFFESTANLNAMRGFALYPEVVTGTALTILIIMAIAALISLRKVLTVDPAIVFRG